MYCKAYIYNVFNNKCIDETFVTSLRFLNEEFVSLAINDSRPEKKQ